MDKKTQDKLLRVNERAKKRRAEGKKICNGCEKWVKLTDFHASKANKDGRVTLCKVCRSKIKQTRKARPKHQKHFKAYNDKPIRCTQCTWTGIEADLDNDLCPDCQNKVRPIYFGTIQDSLQALKEIGQEMMPQGI